MAYDLQVVQKILSDYDKERSRQKQLLEKRKEAIYQKLPRAYEIDKEIARLGIENTKKIINDPEHASTYNHQFRTQLSLLEREKNILLQQADIPKEDMTLHYTCPLCQDTGYIKNKKCTCFEQKLLNAAYAQSNIGEILKNQNFDTFNFSYYSKEHIPSENTSAYQRIKTIYGICKEFSSTFDTYPKSLLFYGNSGLGKTFLSSCITKSLIDQGKTVIYTRATRLFSIYEDYKFGRSNPDEAKQYLDQLYEADLLILDDLGTEQQNKTTLPFLFDLFNGRTLSGKKMVISTNYSIQELERAYSTRLVSRLYEYFHPLKFLGTDIRVLKMQEETVLRKENPYV